MEHLELGPGSRMLADGAARWSTWAARFPALAVAVDAQQLREVLRTAEPEHTDTVLHALATLAADDGHDDHAAAAVLAFQLLPAARKIGRSLRDLSPDIDHLVAGALWIQVRTFPWQRLTKVAANIVLNTRKAVMRELTTDPSRVVLVAPGVGFWEHLTAEESEPDPRAVLHEVLTNGYAVGAINAGERRLMLMLLAIAHTHPTSARGRGGLLSNHARAEIAHRFNISPSTVSRDAQRCMAALAATATTAA